MQKIAIAALVFFAGLIGPMVPAAPPELVARHCRVERMPQARAACINLVADERGTALEGRIFSATAQIQATTGPELRAFEDGLRTAQDRWRIDLAAACATEDPVAEARCRLSGVLAREEQVADLLDGALAELGAPPMVRPDDFGAVEVTIPLRPPSGTDRTGAFVDLPLLVPLRP